MKREHFITATYMIIGGVLAAIGVYGVSKGNPWLTLVLALCVGVGSTMVGIAWGRMPPFSRWFPREK